MTPKQQKFCDEYLIDCNATQAAIRAGYSPKAAGTCGARLLANAGVRARIDAELEKLHSAKIADAEEVLQYLTAVLRGEYTEEIPLLCGNSCQTLTQKEIGAKERLKAAELLGKRYGLYTERVDLDADLDLHITVDYGDRT